MKKIMLFAVAILALAACSKEQIQEPQCVTSFKAGQKVTISVATAQTKMASSLNGTTGAIEFAWEEGDKIKVTVGTESSDFTLKTGAGTATATFEGTMPAAGDSFDVQYPTTDPDLSTQAYVANGLPKDKMKMIANGCTLGNNFSLTPQYAALQLNLWGSQAIGRIVVTNTTSTESPKPSYTLDCATPIDVSSDTTAFMIVVPAGTSNWKFSASVFDGSTSFICQLDMTSVTYFQAGKILNMPAPPQYTEAPEIMPSKIGDTWWAPVNCGYDANHKYGLLYQFGRKVGSTYGPEQSATKYAETGYQTIVAAGPAMTSDGCNKNPNDTEFYVNGSADWYTTTNNKNLPAWPMKSTDAGYVKNKLDNPCPDGWRIPTDNEFTVLMGGQTDKVVQDGNGLYAGMKGKFFNGSSAASTTSGIFLPAAGVRMDGTGIAVNRDTYSNFWSCTILSNIDKRRGRIFTFGGCSDMWRAYAISVRCVK